EIEGIYDQSDATTKIEEGADIDHDSETVFRGGKEDSIAGDRNSNRLLTLEYESARPRPEAPIPPISLPSPSSAHHQNEQQTVRIHPPSIFGPRYEEETGNENPEPGNIRDGIRVTNIGTNSHPGVDEQQTAEIYPTSVFGPLYENLAPPPPLGPQLEDQTRKGTPELGHDSGGITVTDVATLQPRKVAKFPDKYELWSMTFGGSKRHVCIVEIAFFGSELPDECLESLGYAVYSYSTYWPDIDPVLKFIAVGRSSAREGETVPGEACEQWLPRWEPIPRIYVPAKDYPGKRGSDYVTQSLKYPETYVLVATSLGPTIESVGIIEIAFRGNGNPADYVTELEYFLKDELQSCYELDPELTEDSRAELDPKPTEVSWADRAAQGLEAASNWLSESFSRPSREVYGDHILEPVDQPTSIALYPEPTENSWAERAARGLEAASVWLGESFPRPSREVYKDYILEPVDQAISAALDPEPTDESWAERAARGLEAASNWLGES
ncbi:hypothetical protein IFR05_010709, partial [Cadophora sp. M221]